METNSTDESNQSHPIMTETEEEGLADSRTDKEVEIDLSKLTWVKK